MDSSTFILLLVFWLFESIIATIHYTLRSIGRSTSILCQYDEFYDPYYLTGRETLIAGPVYWVSTLLGLGICKLLGVGED